MDDPKLSRKVFGSSISGQSFLIAYYENVIKPPSFNVISVVKKETLD